jgi:spermidine synthase
LSRRRLFVWLYAGSGAAALIYEVTWTRLLTLLLGHTVAAASAVLAAMMGGLAIGAWTAGRFVSRHPVAELRPGRGSARTRRTPSAR